MKEKEQKRKEAGREEGRKGGSGKQAGHCDMPHNLREKF